MCVTCGSMYIYLSLMYITYLHILYIDKRVRPCEELYVFGCRMFIASKSKPEISARWTTKEDLRVIMYQYSFAHDPPPFLPICDCCESVHLSA